MPSSAAHTTPGQQSFGRFPPSAEALSEQALDPYFVNFENLSRELETLLQGNMEKVNRRLLNHLSSYAEDLAELGARYNAFSLSEQSPSLAAAIERIGQAADSTYIETSSVSAALGENFAEPMRESAQFASVVRSVLRYRILKRVQQEMTKDELERKRLLLNSLERSEHEAQRIDRFLTNTAQSSLSPSQSTKRTAKPSSVRNNVDETHREDDTASIDSDFPPIHSETPSASQGGPHAERQHRTSTSGSFVMHKILGRLNHAIHGIVDVDPERTRRDQISKTKESLTQV